jgi:hypothetical protein
MAFNEDEAFKELEKKEVKTLEEDESIKKLISSSSTIFKTIKIGEQPIRIKAYMPRTVRIRLLKTGNSLKSAKTDEQILKIEGQIYPIIASMCMDPPFNDVKTWIYLDEKIGCAQNVLIEILGEVTVTDKSIEKFR